MSQIEKLSTSKNMLYPYKSVNLREKVLKYVTQQKKIGDPIKM